MIEVAAAVLILTVGTVIAVVGPRVLGNTAVASPASGSARARDVEAAAAARPRPTDPFSTLVDLLRRKPWVRRGLSILSIVLLLGAGGMIGYPFYTNLVQSRLQSKLDDQLASPELEQAYLDRKVGIGESLTRLQIPKLDVDVIVVQGTTASALRAGAGHYVDTPLPCEVGNVAIAGHRTTYGKPFHNVDLLAPGDEIILTTPIGQCSYQVSKAPFPVAPNRYDVVANTPKAANLTLTTCHPKGSARQRLVVHARMVSSTTQKA
jgi:sortase A